MRVLSGPELNKIFKAELDGFAIKGKSLIIILGVLGDFDSFEYIQSIVPYLSKIEESGINLSIIALGSEEAKNQFCRYTNLPKTHLTVLQNIDLHKKLLLNDGLNLNINPLFNLFFMCLGINSPGTLSEVIRGYTGDKKANKLFNDLDTIHFSKYINFNAELFNILGNKGFLRPFELASLRLMNMIEVLNNWNLYMSPSEFITQRGATYLLDSEGKLLYSYKSNALLDFSETMSNPLEYLELYT